MLGLHGELQVDFDLGGWDAAVVAVKDGVLLKHLLGAKQDGPGLP